MLKMEEVFSGPFELRYSTIFDSNGRICITILNIDDKASNWIVDKLNGSQDSPINGKFKLNDDDPSKIIYEHNTGGDVPILLIRGWGRLIGVGGFNLPVEEAVKIQNEFSNWVVNTLNK